MSDGNRGLRIAVIGALACLSFAVLGAGAYFGALNAPNYGYQTEHPANRTPQAEQQNPSQIDRDRAGLPYFAERIASGPDAESRDERESRDLAAQESMSVWAFWLLLVSSAGTVTTMIGTGFLLWQIVLTREAVKDTGNATKAMNRANEIAEDASQRQLRAYLSVQQVSLVEDPWSDKGLALKISIKNNGQTPAEISKVRLIVEWLADGATFSVLDHESDSDSECHNGIPTVMPFLFAEDFKGSENPGYLIALGYIQYLDAFNRPHRAEISHGPPVFQKAPLKDLDLPFQMAGFPLSSFVGKDIRRRVEQKGERKES